MAYAVGIDLGTTNTVVAAVRDGVAVTLADGEGRRLIPSVVSFHPNGATLVGHGALDRRLVDAGNTVYSVKRLMGRAWASPEVQQARPRLPFTLEEGATGGTVVVARGESFSLPEISAFVLRQAKAVAEAALGEKVERAVITVPANFNDLQRAATKTAGRIAGLEVLRILNEPTAAALAYGPPDKDRETIAIYDLGGGTFDVTVLDLAGNVFEVRSTAGDTALGGDDLDLLVAGKMADDLLSKFRFDARANPAALGRLRVLGERMKCELSTREEHTITVDDLVPGNRGATVPWRYRMTRTELEWASLPLVERTFAVCKEALESADLQPSELERVILVGGATRMPLVGRKAEQFFGRAPVVRINPDEVVALGAAIQASLLDPNRRRTGHPLVHPRVSDESLLVTAARDDAPVLEPIPLPLVGPKSLGAATAGAGAFLPGAMSKPLVFEASPEAPPAPPPPPSDAAPVPPLGLRPANSPPPVPKRTQRGAAPATITGQAPPQPRPRAPTMPFPFETAPSPGPPRPAPLLIDVTPLSLSVETVGGYCDVLIDANTPVPCDRTRAFSTASEGQTSVKVRVAQGPSKRFEENTCLGEVELSGIAPAARGETQIAVTFEIDADGILNVRARDVKSGQEGTARLQLVGAGAPEDVERMKERQSMLPIG